MDWCWGLFHQCISSFILSLPRNWLGYYKFSLGFCVDTNSKFFFSFPASPLFIC